MKIPNGIKVLNLHRLSNRGPLKAFTDISICDHILIKGFRIIESKYKDIVIGWPKEKAVHGKFYAAVEPLSKEIEEVIFQTILEAYKA